MKSSPHYLYGCGAPAFCFARRSQLRGVLCKWRFVAETLRPKAPKNNRHKPAALYSTKLQVAPPLRSIGETPDGTNPCAQLQGMVKGLTTQKPANNNPRWSNSTNWSTSLVTVTQLDSKMCAHLSEGASTHELQTLAIAIGALDAALIQKKTQHDTRAHPFPPPSLPTRLYDVMLTARSNWEATIKKITSPQRHVLEPHLLRRSAAGMQREARSCATRRTIRCALPLP